MISIKIWETPLFWQGKCSLPVAVRVSETRVLKLPSHTRGRERGLALVFYLKLETTRCLNNRFTYFIIHIHVLRILDFEKKASQGTQKIEEL